MKKLILNLNNDISRFLINDSVAGITQRLECPVEGCKGMISLNLNQRFSGAAAICNKCNKAILLKEFQC